MLCFVSGLFFYFPSSRSSFCKWVRGRVCVLYRCWFWGRSCFFVCLFDWFVSSFLFIYIYIYCCFCFVDVGVGEGGGGLIVYLFFRSMTHWKPPFAHYNMQTTERLEPLSLLGSPSYHVKNIISAVQKQTWPGTVTHNKFSWYHTQRKQFRLAYLIHRRSTKTGKYL